MESSPNYEADEFEKGSEEKGSFGQGEGEGDDVHAEEFDIDMTKQQQVRQSLLDQRRHSQPNRTSETKGKKVRYSEGYHAGSSESGVEIQAANLEWILVIIEFFGLRRMINTEKQRALQIERFFVNIRLMHVKKKFLKLIYLARGYNRKIGNVPISIATNIFKFLTQKELLIKASRLSTQYRHVAHQPYLWRKISLFATKDSFDVMKDARLASLIKVST